MLFRFTDNTMLSVASQYRSLVAKQGGQISEIQTCIKLVVLKFYLASWPLLVFAQIGWP